MRLAGEAFAIGGRVDRLDVEAAQRAARDAERELGIEADLAAAVEADQRIEPQRAVEAEAEVVRMELGAQPSCIDAGVHAR